MILACKTISTTAGLLLKDWDNALARIASDSLVCLWNREQIRRQESSKVSRRVKDCAQRGKNNPNEYRFNRHYAMLFPACILPCASGFLQ